MVELSIGDGRLKVEILGWHKFFAFKSKFLIPFDHLILHGEVMLGIDGAFFRHQVANVTVGGEDFEVLAEVLLDGLHLAG